MTVARTPRGAFSRVVLVSGGFAVWMALIGWRLYDLQVSRHDEYRKRADRQQQRVVSLDSPRGTIFDARGRQLAVSVEVESVAAVPGEISDPRRAASALAGLLDLDAAKLERQFESDREFVWVARKLDPPVAQRVRGLAIKGLRFLPESKRYYPLRSVAAHVLGYVGIDNQGLAGLEAEYDKQIAGTAGRRTVLRDARRGTVLFPDLAASEPRSGDDLHLTLDAAVQSVVERELAAAIEAHGARAGSAVFLDPRDGAVIALASYPGFDPNEFAEANGDRRRNRVVQDAYEPGSTFKMITAVAALEANAMDPTDVLDCEMGDIRLYGTLIHDHKAFGRLTMSEVLTYSSNVGAIKIGLAAGQNQLYRTLRQFGFGEPTGIDLPGESSGIVPAVERWSPIAKAYISFGQGVSVTPLQLTSAFAAVANGGRLLRPYLVGTVSRDGVVAASTRGRNEVREVRQVASPASIRSVGRMLELVVSEGTGKAARTPGYSAAGKTGTAQKAGKGGYLAGRYVASFVGYAPARDPVFVGLIVIDEPLGGRYHGGDVAAPVFAAIAREALLYFGVSAERERPPRWPHEPPPPPARGNGLQVALGAAQPVAPSAANAAAPLVVAAGPAVPDFSGLTGRDAFYRSARLGLLPVLHGQGFVARQSPPAGAPLASGQRIDLVLEGSPAPVPSAEVSR